MDLGKNPLCLYHADCADGMAAAWAVLHNTGWQGRGRPISYADDVPANVDDRDVIMVDFCFDDVEKMAALLNRSHTLTVIDHHKSAEGVLRLLAHRNPGDVVSGKLKIKYDQAHSGAFLAWEYYQGAGPPPLIKYVQDRDLWKWELPFSREINAYIATCEATVESYSELSRALLTVYECTADANIVKLGSRLLKQTELTVEKMARRSTLVWFEGYLVLCAAAPVFHSEVGHVLSKDMPFAVTYYDAPDGTRVFSLRRQKWGEQELDMTVLAGRYGGGGHAAAAGFQVPADQPDPVVPVLFDPASAVELPWRYKFPHPPIEMVRAAVDLSKLPSFQSEGVAKMVADTPGVDPVISALTLQNMKGRPLKELL